MSGGERSISGSGSSGFSGGSSGGGGFLFIHSRANFVAESDLTSVDISRLLLDIDREWSMLAVIYSRVSKTNFSDHQIYTT